MSTSYQPPSYGVSPFRSGSVSYGLFDAYGAGERADEVEGVVVDDCGQLTEQ
jgi:hypothetical protein